MSRLAPRDPARLRARSGRAAVAFRSLIRRMAVVASRGGMWQLEGYEGERHTGVEHFGGIGFHSRPRRGNDAEVVIVNIGGKSGHPVIVATRDEGARVELEEDETAIFNSTGAVVKITASGDIEIQPAPGGKVYVRTEGGATEPLVTRSTFENHTHATAPTGPITPPQELSPSVPPGFSYTRTLEAE